MKGVEFERSSHTLEYKDDLVRPSIQSSDQVLVHVLASGICGTDLHLIAGGMDEILSEKIILGHETVGRVAEVGSKVEMIKVGQCVTIQPMGRCFQCATCQNGYMNLCQYSLSGHLGYKVSGGWADFCVVEEHQVYPISDECLPPELAVLVEPLGGILNGWRQLSDALTMDKQILILGGGLIGILWAAVLSYRGFRDILVSEPSSDRRETLNAITGVSAVSPDELFPRYEGKVDILIECCTVTEAIESAMRCLADGASILLFGIYDPKTYLSINLIDTVLKEYTFVSVLGNNHTFSEAIALVSTMHRDGSLSMSKVGMRSYSLKDYERALRDLAEKVVTKAILLCH